MATIEDMEEIVFGCCGAVVWLPKVLLKEKRETRETFYCPNGHRMAFKKTTAEVLREQLDRVKQSLAEKADKLSKLKDGKCPLCWKTVNDLSGHLKRMH